KIIKAGRVKVDGNIVTDIYYQTRPNKVTIDGKPVKIIEEKVYFILNKPLGYSCQKTDHPNVLEIVKVKDPAIQNMLFTIGRLDVETSGLLIVTNDGAMVHKVLQPVEEVWKTYYATTDKEIPKEGLEKIRKGITIKLEMNRWYDCFGAKIEQIGRTEYEIKIKEGKKRQIRRMLEAVGCETVKLHRQAIGNLSLPKNLKEGEFVAIKKEDLRAMFEK
ncbi:MAG TPA: pseudouridine synthase, partial [Candidatus Nanoarchaeia archaeon]|nr:pseudouridine synthase [Candidatus Nanoarchaeia archaeon]